MTFDSYYHIMTLLILFMFSVQQMFDTYRGDVYLPSTLPSSTGTIFWTITQNQTSSDVYIKVSQTTNQTFSIFPTKSENRSLMPGTRPRR
jgi:hypothetical protein